MSKEHELPSDSDEDDEDYVPPGAEEVVSEAESEGEAESGPEDENNENERRASKKKGKKRSSSNKKNNKRRKIADAEEEEATVEEESEKKTLTEEEEKKKADSLWSDFMKSTETTPAPKPQNSSTNNSTSESPIIRPKAEEKVKITKVFEFAGEEVRVEKEVPADSAEARLSLSTEKPETTSNDSPRPSVRGRGVARRGGLGGISSVLGQIGKKAKISTLEKSKLDWENYKKAENLDEEITTHNRGKGGFLERQDFLQRSDLRQWEIERKLRACNRRSNR